MRLLIRSVVPLFIALAISCGAEPADASDGDLQQYSRPAANAEAANAANALTSSLLLPTDGKLITADANSAGKAPVNRGLKQLADLAAGVWCGTFGNCAGVHSRTLKSLHVDGSGGVNSSATSGNALIHGGVEAQTGDIVSDLGDLVAAVGNINAFTGKIHALSGDIVADLGVVQALNGFVIAGDPTTPRYGQLSKGGMYLYGTLTTNSGANPAQGVSIKNQQRAKNIVKHYIRVATNSANTIILQDGAGAWSPSIITIGGATATTRIRITMVDVMDNATYTVTCSVITPNGFVPTAAVVLSDTMTTAHFDVAAYDLGGGGWVDLTGNARDFSCIVMGQQTT